MKQISNTSVHFTVEMLLKESFSNDFIQLPLNHGSFLSENIHLNHNS